MWTGIIAVIAFCIGFFLSSLLACARAADVEMEGMRAATFIPNGRHRKATRGPAGRRIKIAIRPARWTVCDSNGAGI